MTRRKRWRIPTPGLKIGKRSLGRQKDVGSLMRNKTQTTPTTLTAACNPRRTLRQMGVISPTSNRKLPVV